MKWGWSLNPNGVEEWEIGWADAGLTTNKSLSLRFIYCPTREQIVDCCFQIETPRKPWRVAKLRFKGNGPTSTTVSRTRDSSDSSTVDMSDPFNHSPHFTSKTLRQAGRDGKQRDSKLLLTIPHYFHPFSSKEKRKGRREYRGSNLWPRAIKQFPDFKLSNSLPVVLSIRRSLIKYD